MDTDVSCKKRKTHVDDVDNEDDDEEEEEEEEEESSCAGPYMRAMYAGKDQDAETPDDLFAQLEKDFGKFGKDMCPNNPDFDGLSHATEWPLKTYLNVSLSLCFLSLVCVLPLHFFFVSRRTAALSRGFGVRTMSISTANCPSCFCLSEQQHTGSTTSSCALPKCDS